MKPIRITAQEQPDGTIFVIKIENVKTSGLLPTKYYLRYPNCHWDCEREEVHIDINSNYFCVLSQSCFFNKEDFERLISLPKQCGKNLSECRKQKEPFVVEI